MKKSKLTRSLLAACSIVALSAVMYGCSSSGEDEAQMNADMYKAQLDALNAAAMAELAEGETLTPETYAQILAAAAADKAEALRLAGVAADEAKAEALRLAGLAADEAKAEALRLAGVAADEAKAEALRLAGLAADEAKAEALRLAGVAADEAKAEALRLAGVAADEAKAEALRLAGVAADEAKAEALRLAGLAAGADKAEALRLAGVAADEAKAEALRLAGLAADEAKAEALRLAGVAADEAKAEALRLAGLAADEAKAEALRLAGVAADEAKAEALRLAGLAAGADKAEALRLAGVAADEAKAEALRLAGLAADEAKADAVAAALGEARATTALSTYATAQGALNIAKATYDLDPTVANAMAYMAAAQAAKTAADAANTAAAHGTDAQQQIAADAVTDTGGAVTAASSAVASATQIAGITADAIQRAMAIVPSPSGMAPAFIVATERTRADGTTVTVTDPNEAGDEDDEKLDASTTTAPYLAASWIGSKHERTDDDGVEEVVTVYTDIANAGDEPFNTYYSESGRLGVTGSLSGGVLNINEDQAKEAGEAGLLSSPHFARSGNQIITYPDDDDTTDDVDESDARMFAGMFHGIPGEYTCTGNVCTSTADKDGNLLTLVGEWSFDPDTAPEGEPHKVFGVTPDPDHIHFGYWLQTTPGEDDDPTTYAFNTFVGGADTFAPGSVSSLEGQAEYEGNAAGIYVRKTLKSTGEVASAVTGEFQADADLTAYFGGADVRASNHFRIEGTVTNFMDGSMELGGWSVKLEKHEFGQNPTDSEFSGGTTVGSEGVDKGAWSGTFYGPDAGDAMPSAVAGEFNAHFTNGHAAGAYGTTIVEEE